MRRQQHTKFVVSDIKAVFGRNVRKLRQKKGVSQEALAHDADLDRTYVSSIERGKRNVSLENIERLEEHLQTMTEDHQRLLYEQLKRKFEA